MATGDDDDDDEDGATTTTTTVTTTMAMAFDGDGATGDGIQQQWRRTTMTTRSMATARRATMMATLDIII